MGIRRLTAAVLVLGACASGCGGTAQGTAVPPGPAATATPLRAPIVMFLGDSYTTGGTKTRPERAYAADAARELGWQVIIGGLGGTGFVAPGATHEPFDALFERQLAWRPEPDMIIVAGGHNDRTYAPARVAAAAEALLAKIRQLWPDSRVLLVGPMWGNGAPDPAVLEIRDALGVVARTLKIPFIDPLGGRWITGDRAGHVGNAVRYIEPDGVHPNAEGHRYLATRLVGELRRLGLTEP
ncbi:MAG TPA: SGNH/GDSL hydrolase family protein [Streptosporangiaceae bacterium]|nr:SGNH/GDSL hydrolase family protein [Streptosporangiaceae bacterium]